MMRMLRAAVVTCVIVLTALTRLAPAARAADDTVRFYGTWRTRFVVNGQTVTMISVHDANGYANYIVTPTGNAPAGSGTFSAANGKYKTSAPQPNDSGTYHFLDDNTVICSNAAGQTVTWKKEPAAAQPRAPAQPSPQSSPQPARQPAQPASPAPAVSAPPAPAYDPSLPASTNAAIAAFNNKDYTTAWRDFMADAQKGNSEAQAGIGAMLFKHINPPGTGYYAQCEKWLLASAKQGNVKGMDFLGQYYYAVGTSIAGGINPGINNAPIPPALQQQADGKFALARQWFERASAKNDGYAMGDLAIMLDAGVGGPPDKPRAAQLREQLKHLTDPNFAKKATSDPGTLAMSASWQSGHYADALKNAQDMAARGRGCRGAPWQGVLRRRGRGTRLQDRPHVDQQGGRPEQRRRDLHPRSHDRVRPRRQSGPAKGARALRQGWRDGPALRPDGSERHANAGRGGRTASTICQAVCEPGRRG